MDRIYVISFILVDYCCREDGKDSMKFYTDPTYFFELWCQEMQKDTEMQKKELKKRKKGVSLVIQFLR